MEQTRLDKAISALGEHSRRDIRKLAFRGLITVNGKAVKSPEKKIDPVRDEVCVSGRRLNLNPYIYIMLNKPAGIVSATRDPSEKTVVDLTPRGLYRRGIFPAGRLDKDTTGFILLTNDGELAHRLLSPKRHVDKTYLVTLKREPSEEELLCLERGVDIGEERPTMPARVCRQGRQQILLTIHEGKFHQVKRMAQAVDNQVTALKRVSFGGLSLDESLHPGEYRPLSEEEVRQLRNVCEK